MNVDPTILLAFVRPELIILIIVLWCIGLSLKKIPHIADWSIPLALHGIGIIFSILLIALKEGFILNTFVIGFIQGIIIAALANNGNEIIKQLFIKRPQDKQKGDTP